MNTKNLFKIGALLVVLSVLSLAVAFGQTVYVDVTNGSDTYTGVNATNSPAGSGPKATINAGIGALTNGGTLVIFAGTYNGGDGAAGAINIATTTLTGITFEFRQLNSNNEVLLSAGAFTYNVNAGTLTIAATNGTEYMTINGLTLGSSTRTSTLNLPVQSYLRMASGNTITLWSTSNFSNMAPQKTTNIQVSYQGGTSLTAGPESNYGTYGTGTITVNKTAGTSVAFSNAMTLGGLTVSSGDATFNGAVTMGTNGIENTSTGTVTFASTVALTVSSSTTNDLGTVLNTSTGNITFNGDVTWTGTNTAAVFGQDVSGQYVIENQSTGAIAFNAAVNLVASDGGVSRDVIFSAYNNAGTLTVGVVTASLSPTTANSNKITLNLFNSTAAGTLNVKGGNIRGYLTNVAGATTNITGATTVGGVFTNAGTVALGGEVLTLSGAAAHATGGGTVTATTGGIVVTAGGSSFNGGALSNLTLNHGTAGTTSTGGVITASNLTVTSGTLSVGANFTVATAGSTTMNGGSITVGNFTFTTGSYTQSAGTFTLANNALSILDVKGNFTRTAGTFSAGLASVTSFTGTSPQSFNGGPLITVGDLTFSNSGGSITLGQSVRVQGSCTINTSTNLSLGTLNIILIGNASGMTNSGAYSASGGGGVIFGGSTTVSGGLAATLQTIAGTGTYSYITVDVGNGNDVTMSAANAVKFNGVLTLTTGNIHINNAGGSFGPSGSTASIIRNLKTGAGSNAGIYITAGSFNPVATAADYDLTYTGAMTATNTLNDVAANGREFTLGNVKNLTFSTTQPAGATQSETRLELVASGAVTIKGDLILTAPASTFVNQVLVPAQSVTVKGMLSVAAGAHLIASDNTKTFTLDADSKTHVVAGTFDIAHGIGNVGHAIQVTGNGSALNGSTVAGDPAQVANLAFEPANNNYSFTSTNLKTITGNLTIEGTATKIGANATVAMNATTSVLGGNLVVGNTTLTPSASVTIAGTSTSTHTGNLTVANGTLTYTRGGAGTTIGGTVTLTAGTLTLGSSVTASGATTLTAGTLVIGAFNYTQVGSGAVPDFTRGTATFTATTGKLVLDATAALDLTPGATFSVPNVEFKGALGNTINAAMTVSNSLINTAGAVNLSGALTFSGNTHTFTAGSYTGSALTYTGSAPTATFTVDAAINSITVNTAGTLTIGSSSSTVGRTITVAGTFTQTAGVVATGINSITITGAFTRAAGTWSQGTGYLVFNTATAFVQGTGLAVDNLQISQSISSSPTSTAFTVNKNLRLVAGTLTADAGKLTLADGCVVERRAGAAILSSVPTFAGAVSVSYTTAGPISTVANFRELPSAVTNFTVTTPSSVTLPKAVTVNGKLTLSGALTMTTTNVITMANNSTLELAANGATVLPAAVNLTRAGTINLIYNGATAVSTRELGTLTSGAYATSLGNVEFKSATVLLDGSLTITGTATFSGGAFDVGAKVVTIQGDVVQTSTTGFFTNSGASANLVFGGANTALTLKATWAVPVLLKFKLSKTAADNTLTLTGGDLDFATNSATLYFGNGLLVAGSNAVVLKQSNASGQPTQGFDRASVTGTNKSHVFGQVKKFVDKTDLVGISRVEFPVGTQNPNYRPFAIYFKNTPQSSVNITVSHASVRAGGQNGYPIQDGALKITNYPDFFWYVKSDISLAPSYLFDMEAQAEGYADYAADGIQNVRFVRRDSGLVSNQWVLQKNNNTNTVLYDNSTIAANWPAVKVVDATGGVTTQGSIFTFSQINKAPLFTAAPGNQTKDEGDTLSVTFTGYDPDLGDLSVMSSVTLPTGATFNATTGKVTWPIGYDLATAATPTATATITIRVTDTYGPLSKDSTVTITINNKNRAPSFTATGAAKLAAQTINDGVALSFNYIAVDGDGDAVTYVGVGLPTGATLSTAGALAWTPTFAQAGSPYTITVVASDAAATDTAVAVVTVNRSRARGDVDGNGTVQAADASLVLQHVTGLATITDAAALFAADASNNGTISAYDAAQILQAAAGLITLPASTDASLAKGDAVEAAGSLSWASPEVTKDAEVVKIGLNIANAANVYAVQMTGKVNENLMAIEGVNAELPDGWEMQWNVVDGELRVAMAGATPMSSGSVAAVMVRLKNKESRLSFSADVMLNETSQPLGAVEIAAVPTEFALQLNYPNPFNPSTTIKYQIASDANVNLVIWNLQGQKIRTMVGKEQKAGYYSVVWDGRNEAGQTVSSGLYLYRVQAGSYVATHKMLLIK